MAKGRKKKEVDPKERCGAVVHATANRVLGDKPAKNIYGNVNYCKHFLQGIVEEAVDRRKEGGKVPVIYLKAKWTVPGGAYPNGKIAVVYKNSVILGPIPEDANKNTSVSVNHPDAVGDPNHSTKGSTTYIPNADAPPNVSATSTTAQQPAATAGSAPAAAAPPVDSNKKARTTNSNASKKQSSTKKRKSKSKAPIDLDEMPIFVTDQGGTKHQVVAITHGRKWVVGDKASINGNVAKGKQKIQWYQRDPFGKRIHPGNQEFANMTALDAYLYMHPSDQLELQIKLTNENLTKAGKKLIDMQELLKWQGVVILVAMADYHGDRRDLWGGGGSYSQYLPSYHFENTGMSRSRFEEILSAMRWSNQPEKQPEGMSSKKYRWMLVNDFVDNFNKHRANNFHPSGDVCADESIIRWYGLGGAYVQLGLPMYLAMERKPDNGAEVQNVACVESNIMMQLKYVDAEEEEAAKEKELNGDEYKGLNHGKYECILLWYLFIHASYLTHLILFA
jgi:hypothetical protein